MGLSDVTTEVYFIRIKKKVYESVEPCLGFITCTVENMVFTCSKDSYHWTDDCRCSPVLRTVPFLDRFLVFISAVRIVLIGQMIPAVSLF